MRSVVADTISAVMATCRRVLVVTTPCLPESRWGTWSLHSGIHSTLTSPTRILALKLQVIWKKNGCLSCSFLPAFQDICSRSLTFCRFLFFLFFEIGLYRQLAVSPSSCWHCNRKWNFPRFLSLVFLRRLNWVSGNRPFSFHLSFPSIFLTMIFLSSLYSFSVIKRLIL